MRVLDLLMQIQQFLQFVKSIYKELPNHLNAIFEPRPALKVKDISELSLDSFLQKTFTVTNIQVEGDGTCASVSSTSGSSNSSSKRRILNGETSCCDFAVTSSQWTLLQRGSVHSAHKKRMNSTEKSGKYLSLASGVPLHGIGELEECCKS